MVQNLKVDIIYHQTPSDFELEFNLCGCCRMRLLSDKTSDKKSFIKALARDVARSRVIIGTGPLFGDEGLIALVARAIGSTLCACDNKTYGINSDDVIKIINGSTPLVTPDGYFGGCIIESGPQTIVLLTENKSFRKLIMQNLIHPYIEEISYTPTNTVAVASNDAEPEFETAIAEQEIYLTQPDEYNSNEDSDDVQPLETTDDSHNIEFIMDGEDATDISDIESVSDEAPSNNTNNGYDIMYTEIESEKDIKARYQDPYVPSESDSMFITNLETDEEEIFDKKKARMRRMDITIVLLVLFLLLAVLALVYFIVLRPITMGISIGDYIKEIFGIASQNTLV